MRFRNLDLNLLAALDKLIRLQSVSRAADELAITQSAMSNALNRLRQYFDDPLLVQIGRRMELTPRAQALAGPVRDILVRIEAAVAAPTDFDPASSNRTFTLMVSDYSLATVVPPFVRRLAHKAPNMRINIKAQQSFPGVQLERGETDLLIAPAVYCSGDHPSELLLNDPIVCILDVNNPAAKALDEETFLALEHVSMQPPQPGHSFSDRLLAERGIVPNMVVSSFSFVSLPDLVRGTNRVAILQLRLAQRLVRMGGVVIVPPPFDLPPLEQRIQWHGMRSRDPALDWLRQELRAAADDPT